MAPAMIRPGMTRERSRGCALERWSWSRARTGSTARAAKWDQLTSTRSGFQLSPEGSSTGAAVWSASGVGGGGLTAIARITVGGPTADPIARPQITWGGAGRRLADRTQFARGPERITGP